MSAANYDVTTLDIGTGLRVLLAIALVAGLLGAGGAAGAASDMASTGEAGWYLGEASLIWGMVNGDMVSVGLGAAGMIVAGGSLIIASGGTAALLAL